MRRKTESTAKQKKNSHHRSVENRHCNQNHLNQYRYHGQRLYYLLSYKMYTKKGSERSGLAIPFVLVILLSIVSVVEFGPQVKAKKKKRITQSMCSCNSLRTVISSPSSSFPVLMVSPEETRKIPYLVF